MKIRCEQHGHDVRAPSFSVILISLAILEAVLTIFEWDSSRRIDRLVSDWIEERTKLGDDYARRLWDAYRNGLAHLFAPKQKGGLVNIVRWAEHEARPCVDSHRKAEFFQVTVRLKPEVGQPPGHFTMYAVDLAKSVLDTLHEKRQLLTKGFDASKGWTVWQKQIVGTGR